jgi:hypothetical protein
MASLNKTWIIIVLAFCAVFASIDAAASKYFRYKNKDGVIVVQDHIPPEAVKGGYQVLNHLFQVIEEVSPAKTEEQIAKENALEKKQRAMDKRRQEQEDSDAILMRTYATVDQIVRVRDERVRTVALDVINTQKIIESQQNLIKSMRRKAADRERKGLKVTDDTRQEIVKAERMIERSMQLLADKKQDVTNVADDFNQKIKRFTQVTGFNVISRYRDIENSHLNSSAKYLHVPCEQDSCEKVWGALTTQIKEYQSEFDIDIPQFLFSNVEMKDKWLVDAVVVDTFETGFHAVVFMRCKVKEESKLLDVIPCQQADAVNLLRQFESATLDISVDNKQTQF